MGDATNRKSSLLTSVVKIFTIGTEPNFSMPWQMRKQQSGTASGFAIDLRATGGASGNTHTESHHHGLRILTNAHAVAYATSVLVRKHGTARKFPARVVAVAHECDLALLDIVDDPTGPTAGSGSPLPMSPRSKSAHSTASEAFWDNLPPLSLGAVPQLQENITVVGYPTGGDNISVTTGVVSRVDITEYSHFGGSKLLAVQIDAAINAGNSGGPAFSGELVAGVAFETLNEAENVGYIIPEPVIKQFLEGIARSGRDVSASASGKVLATTSEDGSELKPSPLVYEPTTPALPVGRRPVMLNVFSDVGIKVQALESSHMKEFYGLPLKYIDDGTGVLVIRTMPLGSANEKLIRGDIILAVDGTAVSDDGTIVFRNSERISFVFLLHRKFPGDTVEITVWRNRKEIKVVITLTGSTPPLVRTTLWDERPRFYIHAGLVFIPLTAPFLRNTWGKNWDAKAPIRLCEQAFNGVKEFPDQESIVLAHVLAADVNIGYRGCYDRTVKKVNGKEVRNLAHLVKLIETSSFELNLNETERGKDGYLQIDLDFDRQILLRADLSEESNAEIFAQHNISEKCSDDLKRFLRANATGTGSP